MFASILEESFVDFLSFDCEQMSVLDRYEFFINKVTEALKCSTPIKRTFKRTLRVKNPVSWWDDECNKIKRLRQACYKKWEYTQDLKDLIEYKKCSALAKKI